MFKYINKKMFKDKKKELEAMVEEQLERASRRIVLKDGSVLSPWGLPEHLEEPACCSGTFEEVPGAGRLPSRVDLREHCSEVEDQAMLNSCSANAVAGAYEYLAKRASGEAGDVSRLFIYYVGRVNTPYFNGQLRDAGMSIGGAINTIAKTGACAEKVWPYNSTYVNARPSEQAYRTATKHRVMESKRIPVDVRAMQAILAKGYPFVFGLKLTERFMRPGPSGVIRTPNANDPRAANHGLHAMLCVGYSDKNQCFIVRNSWGARWGDNGYCYIPYNYMASPSYNCGDNYAITEVSDLTFGKDSSRADDGGRRRRKKKGLVTTCGSGHPLQKGYTPMPNFSCDVCRRTLPAGAAVARCLQCQWDGCEKCAEGADPNEKTDTCSNGHTLVSGRTPSDFFICDVCKRRLRAGTPVARCRPCQWDGCDKCAEATGGRYGAAGPSDSDASDDEETIDWSESSNDDEEERYDHVILPMDASPEEVAAVMVQAGARGALQRSGHNTAARDLGDDYSSTTKYSDDEEEDYSYYNDSE